MNEFYEFFIVKLLWIWLPLYAFYRLLKDVFVDLEGQEQK
jgi:hypothetical protein